jgi:hypothetical protein
MLTGRPAPSAASRKSRSPSSYSDRIAGGAEAVRDLLASREPNGVARVAHAAGEFIVVLPLRAPIIAFAARQSSS